MFKDRFSTTKQKAIWQKQLFDAKQGTDTVDAYVTCFKQLQIRVDPDGNFPPQFLLQLFIQGLRPEYSVNVQATEPADLNTAITSARRWETGRVMANPHGDTDNAIKKLTDQIAQLSINLAQQQTKPTLLAETNPRNQSWQNQKQDDKCYYCGRRGHFIADCRIRENDRRQNSDSYKNRDRDNRNNYNRDQARNSNRSRSRSRDNNNQNYDSRKS
jgi:Retrotransposon gag protein/Zinc knuckle